MVSRWLASWRRNRLFRKYLVPFVAVVLLALLSNGLLEIYFAYQENKSALARLQREKAASAAQRIEGFVREIERQMGWTTQPYLALAGGLEERRLDYLRLQRQVPAITDVAYLDARGREQLRISRLAMEVIGSGVDVSTEPRFTETRTGRTWYGPVYFRRDSEPYMALAVPHGTGGGVSVAEVNLKFIWDVVSQIRIGKFGHAYVVEAGGHLIAHPDISLVLKKTNLSELPQIRAARAAALAGDDPAEAIIATSLDGRRALVAHTAIPSLGWIVVVEQPLIEAFAPLRGSIVRTALLMLLGVLVSVAASLVLARKMASPIQALHAGAARIGAGDLAHEIDVRTHDELEDLASEFNRMTTRLRESYATLEQRVEERTSELREALDQQTATSEILGVISSSPTDLRPVFDAILVRATRLCSAHLGVLYQYDGEAFEAVSYSGAPGPGATGLAGEFQRVMPAPVSALGRLLRTRAAVHIPDVTDDAAYREADRLRVWTVDILGARTFLAVPMLREQEVVGAILIYRPQIAPFDDKQIALVQTFANQAVIAIENVRLFHELQSRNAALTEALDQRTATAEILRVISSSPTDIEPVMQAIVESAARLCEAQNAQIFRVEDENMRLVARYGPVRSTLDVGGVRPITRGSVSGRTIVDRVSLHIPDLLAEAGEEYPDIAAAIQREHIRATVGVPLLREGVPIGSITAFRTEARPFTEQQVALLQTFADQAVIAIENARLFDELQARNRDLTEALERQTATSEILRFISRFQTDVQPVFDAIAAKALELCRATTGWVYRFDGELINIAAAHSLRPGAIEVVRQSYPMPPSRGGGTARAILSRSVVYIPDIRVDHEYTLDALAKAADYLSVLAVPMLLDGKPIGAVTVTGAEAGAFSQRQIELLQTFADQAVIAVENVRLFRELQGKNTDLSETLEQQTATSEILRVISSSPTDVQPVFDAIVASAVRLCDATGGALFRVEEDHLRPVALRGPTLEAGGLAYLSNFFPAPIASAGGLVAEALRSCVVVQSEDVERDPRVSDHHRQLVRRFQFRSQLVVPMLRAGVPIGAISVTRLQVQSFTPKQIELLKTFAEQAVIAIENVRLFHEIQQKSRQLEAANRHKDEFLASMSHELRTPLNAVIGFSEVLLERMFGELNAKQEEYLHDILTSGRHLLSLINDILDLAKIEAGRMELDVEEFEVAQAIDNAVVLVRERATRKGLALETTVAPALGTVHADQRKVKQVLLNLLSNAIKFTPEGGRVEVRAQRADDHVEISVSDTGIGIAVEDQEAVFEEFRQVGTDYAKKHEGTGLGLTLSRKFVELHGGRIALKSRPREGSTFTFTLPVRAWPTS